MADNGIDIFTTGIFEYENGAKAHFDCGMVLETEKNTSLDRFQIHGSKGSITSENFAFNAPGKLSYRLRTFDGTDEVRTVDVPHNYRLEVEQLGRLYRRRGDPICDRSVYRGSGGHGRQSPEDHRLLIKTADL